MSIVAATIDSIIEKKKMDSGSASNGDGHGSSTAGDKNVKEKRPLYSYNSDSAAVQPRPPSPSSSPYILASRGRGNWQGGNTISIGDDVNPVPSPTKFRDPGPSDQSSEITIRSGSSSSRKHLGGLSLSFKRDLKNGCFSENEDAMGKMLNDKQEIVAAAAAASEVGSEMKQQRPMYSPAVSKQSVASSSGYGEEFFDAFETPFDDTSSQSDYETCADASSCFNQQQQQQPPLEIQPNSHKAEEVLEIVLQKLAAGGLEVPPTLGQVEDLDIAGQLYIKRFVEAAVARGAARAEVEEQLGSELDLKNSEIENKSREVIRLRDKVRYNELVSREMCQRNQEAVELARNKRRTRQRVARWAIAGACVVVGIGVTIALVRKYTPLQSLRAVAPPTEDSEGLSPVTEEQHM